MSALKWLDNIRDYLKKRVKYTASDPGNFEVLWTFRATRLQLYSLCILFLLVFAVLTGLFVVKGPLAYYFSKNDVTIERAKLEEQNLRIKGLNAKLAAQEKYLVTLRRIMNGETIEDSSDIQVPEVAGSIDGIVTEPTGAEKEISEKVKDDLRTGKVQKKDRNIPFFSPPVVGVISQNFDATTHPGVDIVTNRDRTVLACLAGTVVYAGYTRKDGNVVIIDHANGYLSVYKHNRAVLKKAGDKIQMNDPVAIVGNTGENSSGPHLHFELWHEQIALDPEKYIEFKN